MDFKDFIEQSGKTEVSDYSKVLKFLSNEKNVKLFHYIIGLSGEVGELTDCFKKSAIYGKPFDLTNFKEELGDIFWFLARILNELNISQEEILQLNIKKLIFRFGDKFSEDKALNKNHDLESKCMEDV